MRTLLTAVLGLAMTFSVFAAAEQPSENDLAMQLTIVTRERDSLRQQLTMAKLRIAQLEAQLARTSAATQPSAPEGYVIEVMSISGSRSNTNLENEKLSQLRKQQEINASRLQNLKSGRRDIRGYDPYYYDKSPTQKTTTLTSLQAEQSSLAGQIAAVERSIKAKQTERVVVGKTALGEVLCCVATGAAGAKAESLTIGTKCRITGTEKTVDGQEQIIVRDIVILPNIDEPQSLSTPDKPKIVPSSVNPQ